MTDIPGQQSRFVEMTPNQLMLECQRLQLDLAICDEAGKRIGAALTSAAILINALLDELIHSSRAADRPLPLQLIAAKGSFDLQIQRLFKTMEPKAEETPQVTVDQAYDHGYDNGESSGYADWIRAFSDELNLDVDGPMDAVAKLRLIIDFTKEPKP